MGPYPIKNCIKSLKYYMHLSGISLIRLFCMCRWRQHTEKRCFDSLLPLKSVAGKLVGTEKGDLILNIYSDFEGTHNMCSLSLTWAFLCRFR